MAGEATEILVGLTMIGCSCVANSVGTIRDDSTRLLSWVTWDTACSFRTTNTFWRHVDCLGLPFLISVHA